MRGQHSQSKFNFNRTYSKKNKDCERNISDGEKLYA